MSTFTDQLAAFQRKMDRRLNDVFVGTAVAVKGSVVDGSAITAAPGQPVQTDALKLSWQLDFETPTRALVSTKIVYAPVIEHNLRGATLRSAVGGFHSVAYTIAGFERLVESEVAKVTAGGG